MNNLVKCQNPNCIQMIRRVKKGGHWKKFCNSKCRSQYHSNTSSKYATPQMTGVAIGSTIQDTMSNQVNNAVGRVSGSIVDRVMYQLENKLKQKGIPIPYYAIGGVVISQAIAKLFGAKEAKTKINMAKWIGGIGAIMDFAFYQSEPISQTEIAQVQEVNKSLEVAKKAKQGDFINASDYRRISIPTIPMAGQYDYLFGMPSRDFYMVLHGLPGNGKTSFAVKFAQYFQGQHGRVLYLASEQSGIDLSLQEILKQHKATFELHTNPRALTEDHLLAAFKNYDLIILDSATDMKFYPSEVKKLQQQSGKAMIAILQSTKDGNFKGSQEWLHDVDISLKVDDFSAVLEKTRYKTASKKIPTKGTVIPI